MEPIVKNLLLRPRRQMEPIVKNLLLRPRRQSRKR
jgi:hypothetical protein